MSWELIALLAFFVVAIPPAVLIDRRREEEGPWGIFNARDARRVERIKRRIEKRRNAAGWRRL